MSNNVRKGYQVLAAGNSLDKRWISIREGSEPNLVELAVKGEIIMLTTDQARSFAAMIMNAANAADKNQ